MTMNNCDEHELLKKLEHLNRNFQMDSKSVQSLSSLCQGTSSTNETANEEKSVSCDEIDSIINTECLMNGKWSEVIKNFSFYSKKKNQIKDLMKQSNGIPGFYRPILWQLLSGCTDDNQQSQKIRTNYPEFLKQQSPCEKAIRRDITRTYPQHELFKDPEGDGQERLFKIMKAYSIYDREVGYCQGTGFIGGLLLIQMPEEEAFVVLVTMMFEYQLRQLYKPNMSELGLYMYQLDCLVEEQLPKLAMHFKAHNFHSTVYASGWFLTLFTLPFSIKVASRIMDLFFLDGIEIIFKISLAYLSLYQQELLKLDMESMLRFLQSVAPQQLEEDSNPLFDLVSTIKLNSRKMKKTEKEYLATKVEEEENQVELRRLRTENGLLLQRIDRLEKEIESLTQNVMGQNLKVAEKSSTIVQLQSDLAESKKQMENLRNNLNDSENQLQMVVNQLNNRFHATTTSGGDLKCDCSSGHGQINFDSVIMQQLQTELVNVRLKEAETSSSFRELKEKYRILEEDNKLLSRSSSDELVRLQDDLVALKLKEAETGLSLKDTQKRLTDLTKLYESHINSCPTSLGNNKDPVISRLERYSVCEGSGIPGSSTSQQQQSTLIRLARKVVESEYITELTISRQRLMEFEAQQAIASRQISRRDEEVINLRDKLDEQKRIQRDLTNDIQEADRRYVDLATKRKEDLMLWKIHKMELESQITELNHKLSSMEAEDAASLQKQNHDKYIFDDVSTEDEYFKSDDPQLMSTYANNINQSVVKGKWKDLPQSIMTESVGPIDELCLNTDDPMITSIYIQQREKNET